MELSKEKIREIIASRVAKELSEGDVITLGIGLPTEVANYVPKEMHIMFQSENGLVGVGPKPSEETYDKDITNAGGTVVEVKEGGAFFDSVMSFAMIRGGHVDATVLGALEVDEEGNLANWMIPGAFVPGMGGAMDLVVGAKKVIVAMEHTSKNGPKIVKKCSLPLTAAKEVDLIITERCVISVEPEGLVLKEINPLFSLDDVLSTISADLIVPDEFNQAAA
ncbi:MAG: 3-oxoacid CoA-transferase subunit B [Alphaproteobacteria bacterium]|nr:3-oxoacid CoA-transferase subunit B [Alphaproteobacteria bacterium]